MQTELEKYLREECPIDLTFKHDIYMDMYRIINRQYPYLNLELPQVQTMVDAELFNLICLEKKFLIFENSLEVR